MKFWLPAKKINGHFLWKRQVFTGDSWGRQMRQNLLQSRPEVVLQNHGSLYKWNLIFHFPYRKWTHWATWISLSRYHIIRLIIRVIGSGTCWHPKHRSEWHLTSVLCSSKVKHVRIFEEPVRNLDASLHSVWILFGTIMCISRQKVWTNATRCMCGMAGCSSHDNQTGSSRAIAHNAKITVFLLSYLLMRKQL